MSAEQQSDLDIFVNAVLGKKAENVVLLEVKDLTAVADVFIVCSGRSNRQVTAISEHVHTTLKNRQIRPLSIEGKKDGHWVLMDYGHVVIHVFYEPVRAFYDIESLWADAPRIETPALRRTTRQIVEGEHPS